MQYTANDKFSYKGKVAVILHIYYKDIWENSIKNRIKNTLNGNCNYDLYVSITKRDASEVEEIRSSVLDLNPNAFIVVVENVGEDVGGFMYCLKEIENRGKEYDYILKLHTKRVNSWRNAMLDGTLPIDCTTLNTLLEKNVAMIGSMRYLYSCKDAETKVDEILSKTGCTRHPLRFVAGTMFWIRFDIIKKYMFGDKLPVDYFNEEYRVCGLRQHAMERVFGMFVSDVNETIQGI